MAELPPFFLFLAGAIVIAVSPARVRVATTLLVPLISGLLFTQVGYGEHWGFEFLGYELELFRVDRLSLIFALLFHIAAFIGGLYAMHEQNRLQQTAVLLYAGSALGAVLAGDLISLFVFWEIAAVSSAIVVYTAGTQAARAAALRYLTVHVGSGVLLLTGVTALIGYQGNADFGLIGIDSTAGVLILIAFGVKAAFPLLHNWLTDAYPEATPAGTVFLSAFTTKMAIYALARGYPGTEALIYIGMVMTAFPIFYAVIENDLRRVLGYSMINQLGFMVCGIGIGTELAINGAVAHAFNDVIFKGLLFMAMGSVLLVTGRINGSDLGGLYRSMPVTTGLCIVGAASISAFPLFAGFVSKSMVMSAAAIEGHHWIWLVLLFASAGVFHHAGIKIPYFAFFAHDRHLDAREPPGNMLVAMGISASLCILIGCFPDYLYALLPYQLDYSAYDTSHVLAQLQLLCFSALAFIWLQLRGIYPPELRSTNLDTDWLYRRVGPGLWTATLLLTGTLWRNLCVLLIRTAGSLAQKLLSVYNPRTGHLTASRTGNMVFWVAVLLGCYLIFYFS